MPDLFGHIPCFLTDACCDVLIPEIEVCPETLHFFTLNSTERGTRTVCGVTHWSAAVFGKVLEPQVIPSSDEYNTDPLYLIFFISTFLMPQNLRSEEGQDPT